jgi:large subunit ribosomal protein L29
MRPQDIRNLTSAEVGHNLDEAYEELFTLRFQKHTGQLKHFARMGELRREVARLKTVLRERELAAWQAKEN